MTAAKSMAQLRGPLQLNLRSLSRESLADYARVGFDLTDSLFGALRKPKNTLLKIPDPLRRPLVFYRAHCSAFFINKMVEAGFREPLNASFEDLFERGVWELDSDDSSYSLDQSEFEWPSLDAVMGYQGSCHKVVFDFIDRIPQSDLENLHWDSPLWAFLMALEHERIHVETSSVLIRQLGLEDVQLEGDIDPVWRHSPDASAPRPLNSFVEVPGGQVVLGRGPQRDENPATYGWCNEYGTEGVDVESFRIQKYLISNGDFLEFVNDDGYSRPELWTQEGAEWAKEHEISHPKFWVRDESRPKGWALRCMFENVPLPEAWPVEVNMHECQAYKNYRARKDGVSYRLPTEAEYELAGGAEYQAAKESESNSNQHIPTPDNANLNMRFGSPCAVNAMAPNSHGIHDHRGNVWQLLEDKFRAYPGFEAHKFYPDFSAPFFDGSQVTSRGGSWASTGQGASTTYRVWWTPHFYQHMGFRLVESN